MADHSLLETFPSLSAISGLRHGFVLRSPHIDVEVDRETAMARLVDFHAGELAEIGISWDELATGEQVHGSRIEVVDVASPSRFHFPDCDGLVTATEGQFLGVYVADCGAVFLVDPVQRACGIVHSGKKGTELGIVPKAIVTMANSYG